MKSRTSEKPAKKKTKSTTAAKSVKKQAKKSVRASAQKKTAAKKSLTAAKKKTPTKAAAKRLPPEPAEVKTESPPPPPPPEPVTPPPPPPQASEQEPEEESSPAATPPVFVKRDLTGPDGSTRPGWEMWIGDHCFGRADSKDLLLASFERLQSPPSSFHWREVRNRMPIRGRVKRPVAPPATKPVAANEEELIDEIEDVEGTPDVS
jgi:hypothetical protein